MNNLRDNWFKCSTCCWILPSSVTIQCVAPLQNGCNHKIARKITQNAKLKSHIFHTTYFLPPFWVWRDWLEPSLFTNSLTARTLEDAKWKCEMNMSSSRESRVRVAPKRLQTNGNTCLFYYYFFLRSVPCLLVISLHESSKEGETLARNDASTAPTPYFFFTCARVLCVSVFDDPRRKCQAIKLSVCLKY